MHKKECRFDIKSTTSVTGVTGIHHGIVTWFCDEYTDDADSKFLGF